MVADKTKWWAVVGRDSGYTLDVKPDERSRYLRSLRKTGEKVVGEFDTASKAAEYLKVYLSDG